MPFSRELIDSNINALMAKAKIEGASSECMFLVDVSLREYIVAVEQMIHEKADRDEVCDSTVFMVCSMIVNLASVIGVRGGESFVDFSNVFMVELTKHLSKIINAANRDSTKVYGTEVLDPNRTEH